MARDGTLQHRKTRRLAARLGIPPCYALGVMEALWEVARSMKIPNGAVGRLINADLAFDMHYTGDPDALVAALVAEGLLDQVPEAQGRLVVHDWAEHAPDYIHSRIARARVFFADGAEPKLTQLPKAERIEAERFYEAHRVQAGPGGARRGPAGPGGSVPIPEPEPVPEPVPRVVSHPPVVPPREAAEPAGESAAVDAGGRAGPAATLEDLLGAVDLSATTKRRLAAARPPITPAEWMDVYTAKRGQRGVKSVAACTASELLRRRGEAMNKSPPLALAMARDSPDVSGLMAIVRGRTGRAG